MNKIGIIGCGMMERVMLNRFLAAKVIEANKIIVSTLVKQYLPELKAQYSGIEICDKHRNLAERCSKIFICVRSMEVKEVLEEITNYIHRDVHLISIAASVSIRNLEILFPGKISRIAPLIVSGVDKGFTLVCHNDHVENHDAEYIFKLFNTLGAVKIIKEKHFEMAECLILATQDLIAAMSREFAEAGVKFGNFSRQEAEQMVLETFYGTSKLFHEKIMKFPDTVSHVATKGGITEVGDALLRERLPGVFKQLFNKTRGTCEHMKTEITRHYNKF